MLMQAVQRAADSKCQRPVWRTIPAHLVCMLSGAQRRRTAAYAPIRRRSRSHAQQLPRRAKPCVTGRAEVPRASSAPRSGLCAPTDHPGAHLRQYRHVGGSRRCYKAGEGDARLRVGPQAAPGCAAAHAGRSRPPAMLSLALVPAVETAQPRQGHPHLAASEAAPRGVCLLSRLALVLLHTAPPRPPTAVQRFNRVRGHRGSQRRGI